MRTPFIFQKLLDYGTENSIVARLSLQIFQILEQCNLTEDKYEGIGELYLNSLQKKLLRCWEIKERFREEFNAAVETYEPPSRTSQTINVPYISRLEEECHNFLYEIKNYIRDLLRVWNLLYGTNFSNASEFFRAKKKGQSLIEFSVEQFGVHDPKTKFLQEGVNGVEYYISLRNAVEHPGGYSGELCIRNFSLGSDGRIDEPTWHRQKDGESMEGPSSIRADMETALHNFVLLGEDIVVSWAADNLKIPTLMQIAAIPPERRDPKCPIKWIVTASPKLEEELGEK